MVISLLSHLSEAGPAQSVELQAGLASANLLTDPHHVDVALLPGTDLVPEGLHDRPGREGLESQVVVAGVSEAIAVIAVASLVGQQSVFAQLLQGNKVIVINSRQP